MPLTTGTFLKKLFTRTVQGDPLGVVEDIRESIEKDKRGKDDQGRDVIDVKGEGSETK